MPHATAESLQATTKVEDSAEANNLENAGGEYDLALASQMRPAHHQDAALVPEWLTPQYTRLPWPTLQSPQMPLAEKSKLLRDLKAPPGVSASHSITSSVHLPGPPSVGHSWLFQPLRNERFFVTLLHKTKLLFDF